MSEFNCPYATTHEVENMCVVAKGPKHGPAPIPEEGRWVKSYQISDISGLSQVSAGVHPSRVHVSLHLTLRRVSSKKHLLKHSVAPV